MTDMNKPYRAVRRIVTGVDENGRSIILMDGLAENVTQADHSPLVAHVLWATGESAAPGFDPAPRDHPFDFHSKNGSILRIVDFPPDDSYDQAKTKKFLDEHNVRDKGTPRHFWFHKTQSLDYAIVLEGEIFAMVDEDETLMTQGDVLIQRATNHSWSNRSKKNCRMAFVLIDAEEGETI